MYSAYIDFQGRHFYYEKEH